MYVHSREMLCESEKLQMVRIKSTNICLFSDMLVTLPKDMNVHKTKIIKKDQYDYHR